MKLNLLQSFYWPLLSVLFIQSCTLKSLNSDSKNFNNGSHRKISTEGNLDNKLDANSKIKIAFAGDIIIHVALYKFILGSDSKNFSQLWKNATPILKSVDYSYANLEGPVATGIDDHLKNRGDIGFVYDGIVYSGTRMLFNYHPNLVKDIKESGINIVSTANNHAYDRGAIGIDKTIDSLRAANLNFVGTRQISESKENKLGNLLKLTQIKDFKVAWISCIDFLNGYKDKNNQLLHCYNDANKISNLISTVKKNKQADIVIVTPHWGIEYHDQENALQKTHARLFLDAGADVIMGSHPHVLEPVEQYKTKDGRNTFIAYSLGNFVSGQYGNDGAAEFKKQTSAIIELEFEKNNEISKISNYKFTPIAFNLKKEHIGMYLADKNSEAARHAESLLSRSRIDLSK